MMMNKKILFISMFILLLLGAGRVLSDEFIIGGNYTLTSTNSTETEELHVTGINQTFCNSFETLVPVTIVYTYNPFILGPVFTHTIVVFSPLTKSTTTEVIHVKDHSYTFTTISKSIRVRDTLTKSTTTEVIHVKDHSYTFTTISKSIRVRDPFENIPFIVPIRYYGPKNVKIIIAV